MFLHLGENVVVPLKDIIGIFDIESTMYSTDTIQFLKQPLAGVVWLILKEGP